MGETFIINTFIRKKIRKNREKQSVGPNGVPGEIPKLIGVAMIPYLLTEISLVG